MNKKYDKPEMEVLYFDCCSVILTSGSDWVPDSSNDDGDEDSW